MPSRRVEWDEKNLADNEEWQRTHPVMMRIDEPKTPYVHIDDDVAAAMDGDETWDPVINAKVKELKERVQNDRTGSPVAPISKGGRPMLAQGTVSGELREQREHEEFVAMRKAVYADEGAKFRALLAQQKSQDDDEDDDE